MFNIHSQVLSLALSCTYGWGERGSSIYFGDFSGYTCSSLTGTCEFYYSGIYCTFFSLFHGTFFLDQFLLGFFFQIIHWYLHHLLKKKAYCHCYLFTSLSKVYLLFPDRSWPLTFSSIVFLDFRWPWFITSSSESGQNRLHKLWAWSQWDCWYD